MSLNAKKPLERKGIVSKRRAFPKCMKPKSSHAPPSFKHNWMTLNCVCTADRLESPVKMSFLEPAVQFVFNSSS